MKLIDGLKLKGNPAEIPDCERNDLPQFFVEMGFKVGAEIGVFRGEFSEKLTMTGLSLYAIDPWRAYKGSGDSHSQDKLDLMYEQTKQLLASYSKCKVIRKTSMEAVEDFEDESLDFVYIDGNHGFRYIAEDLAEWTKKVRIGGIISGHDYFFRLPKKSTRWDVGFVLDAYIKAYRIKNWFVLGRKHAAEGEKRDKWRSWMFIKDN